MRMSLLSLFSYPLMKRTMTMAPKGTFSAKLPNQLFPSNILKPIDEIDSKKFGQKSIFLVFYFYHFDLLRVKKRHFHKKQLDKKVLFLQLTAAAAAAGSLKKSKNGDKSWCRHAIVQKNPANHICQVEMFKAKFPDPICTSVSILLIDRHHKSFGPWV